MTTQNQQTQNQATETQQQPQAATTPVAETKSRSWVKPTITVLGIGILAAGAYALFKFGRGDGVVEEIADTIGEALRK
mgnify:CR=1 FL=1